MTAPQTTPDLSPRTRLFVSLRDLGVAPENVRFKQPADDGIAELAATIRAAGLLMPLTVRPGRRKEKPHMALDGRRRLLALERLVEDGHIRDDHPVEVVEEIEPARQAAAAVLTNTALPLNVADVIVSIGRMLKSRLSVQAIASALGYEELQVRRLAALSGLHATAIDALRQGKITLKQARLLARTPDPELQAELGRLALSGAGFQEWRVTGRLNDGRVTALDPRFPLVGLHRYLAAGGRTESDLFGELPDALVDVDKLDALWRARAKAAADLIGAGEGVAIHIVDDRRPEPPEGLEPLGYVYANTLTVEALAEYRRAQELMYDAAGRARSTDLASDEGVAAAAGYIVARLAAERAGHPGMDIRAVALSPACALGLEADFFVASGADEVSPDGTDHDDESADPSDVDDAQGPQIHLDGVSHALHLTRTDMATRGLVRALADDPSAALATLVARLFTAVVLEKARPPEEAMITVSARGYASTVREPVDALDGEVRLRLAERRASYEASGLRPIPWVAGLPHGERMTLLAELTALSVDLREVRTSSLRRAARADAADLAELLGGVIQDHWTPDATFLQAHSKRQLLAYLDEMGAADDRARALRKDELVGLVAERAAERGWAPASLSWVRQDVLGASLEVEEPELDGDGDEAEQDEEEAAVWPASTSSTELAVAA